VRVNLQDLLTLERKVGMWPTSHQVRFKSRQPSERRGAGTMSWSVAAKRKCYLC